MGHIIIVTHGTAGDVLQLCGLASGLRERGHEVVMLTHGPYADRVRQAGAQFVGLDTESEYARHMAETPQLLSVRSPADLAAFYEHTGLFEQLRFEVRTMLALHRPGQTVLVGRHGSALSVPIAAAVLGAPAVWVALYPSQLVTAPVAAYYAARGLGSELSRIRDEFGLPADQGMPPAGTTNPTLALWPTWFDAAGTPAPPEARVTGFIPGDDESPCVLPPAVTDLSRGVRPVLVTGGTGRMLHADFYTAAIRAVARVGRPALVVTPYRDLLPDPLPAHALWVPSLPFAAVLPAVDAIVHHGGIGTIMRALRSGTPQVILAHGLDRPDNAARLAHLGLAEWSPPDGWHVASKMLGSALADTGYPARAANQLRDDHPKHAVSAAAEVLEGLLAGKSGARAAR